MFPGNIGMTELLIVLFIVLIIFGAGKLPEIGSGLGRAIRNFKKGATGEPNEVQGAKEKELSKDDPSK